jgi:hypothetical protein
MCQLFPHKQVSIRSAKNVPVYVLLLAMLQQNAENQLTNEVNENFIAASSVCCRMLVF